MAGYPSGPSGSAAKPRSGALPPAGGLGRRDTSDDTRLLEAIKLLKKEGGGNFMTCRSVAQAMLGGLLRGESGKSYLVGDVNLTWQDFYGLWYEAAGNPRRFEVRDEEHPILSREIISYLGGGTPDYEPPADETELLGYDRGVIFDEVKACYEYYSTR